MKRIVPLGKTFDVIRSMQPTIEFAGIEQFVLQHSVVPSSKIFHWIHLKNILPMFTITSAVAATLLLTQPFHHSTQPVSQIKNKNTAAQPAAVVPEATGTIPFKEILRAPVFQNKEVVSVQPLKEAAAPADLSLSNIHPENENILPNILPPLVLPADSPAKKKVVITSTNGNTVTVISSSPTSSSNSYVTINHGRVSATSSSNGDSTEVIVSSGNGSTNISKHVEKAASKDCNCSFGDDDEWIEKTVQELLKQNLVKSACDYKFRLTPNGLNVEGKDISDKELISKIMDFYQSASGKALKDADDYIEVKVGNGHCSFSKNINE